MGGTGVAGRAALPPGQVRRWHGYGTSPRRILKKADQPSPERIEGASFTFPDHARLPTTSAEFGQNSVVPCPVSREFLAPVVNAGGGRVTPAAVVTVPKAAMHEDNLASGSEDEIGTARQVLAVEAIAVAETMEQPPDDHLRAGVPLSDGGHDLRADRRCDVVGHGRPLVSDNGLEAG